MRQFIIGAILIAIAVAQSDGQGGWFCNYTARGDEVVENAVPIYDFRTSGNNATQKNWCIAYCADRTSLKGTVRFEPYKKTMVPSRFTRLVDLYKGGRTAYKSVKGAALQKLDNQDEFCPDQTVSSTIDAVFSKYNNIDDYAQQLAYYVNRPQWAFLVYELVPDASGLISTENAPEDENFCMKTVEKGEDMFQVFSGYVAN